MTESASRLSDNSDPRFVAPVREGQTVAGKYVVGRALGVGGMGMVYAARDTLLDRQVAIKVLLPRLISSQTATQRFTREARAATRITSEHVVKLLEIDTLPDGTPLLVMEYLEGRDLRAVLREDGPLPPRVAVDYLLQALQAVAEGHMQTIVHRDLKPSNLFLTMRADGSPLIKVLDFGIAKTLEPEPADTLALTSSEDVRLGSPTYMPPEQLQNARDVDMRSDIWALGVTLHELVSGSPPFQGQTYAELLTRILTEPPESLKTRIPDLALPEGLSEIVSKCLEKKRERRYANAVELATALAPFGSDDARLSLYRVTGLARSPASPRPISSGPATIVSDLLATCETTMPVPVDLAHSPLEPHPESGRRPIPIDPPPLPTRDRATFVLGVAAAIAIGALLWHQVHVPDPRAASAASAQTALASLVSAAQTAPGTARLEPAAAVATSTAAAAIPVRQNKKTGGSADTIPATAKTAVSHGLAAASPNAKLKPALSAPSPTLSEASATATTTPPERAPEPEPSALGPSPLIERLIEQRH